MAFVDEAQNTPNTLLTKDVLDSLHRHIQDIPMITAFFGLTDALSMLGLSHLERRHVVGLGMLSEQNTKCAIQSVFDTYGFNGSRQQDWIEALASLSQNWPQHISSVSSAAGQVICDHAENWAVSQFENFPCFLYKLLWVSHSRHGTMYKKIVAIPELLMLMYCHDYPPPPMLPCTTGQGRPSGLGTISPSCGG